MRVRRCISIWRTCLLYNGAAEQVVEFCVVDDFYFFPYLAETQPPHEFYAEVLAVLQPEATRCKCAVEVRRFSLRAPPAA